jgi:hypothetical protein
LKFFNFWSMCALVICATLTACGGGNDQPEAVKPVAQVRVSTFDCNNQGQPLTIGEVARPVKCFFVLSDSNVTLTGLDLSISSVNQRQLSSVTLLASANKGWQELSSKTNFGPSGKLVLKTSFKLTAGLPVHMRIVTDLPYLFDSVEGNVQLNFGALAVEYDKASYSDIKMTGELDAVTFAVENAAPAVISPSLATLYFLPSASGFVLMGGWINNPSNHELRLESGSIHMVSSFDWAHNWIGSCMSDMQVHFYSDSYQYMGGFSTGDSGVSTYNQYYGGVTIPAGQSAYMQVAVNTSACGGSSPGEYLSMHLYLEYRYPHLLRPTAYSYQQMGVVFLPYYGVQGI